ncbi:MAG: type I methionyl aminopeptidase [Patescibacteria group bacterium]|jgi:methionyl aminopeptidase
MITIKTEKEIRKLAYSGKILSKILRHLFLESKPGVTTAQIDEIAERMIREVGGTPAFKNYQSSHNDPPFPSTICASINNQLVHAPASPIKKLKSGDIFTIDIGMEYEGLYTDMAATITIGKVPARVNKLIKVTKKSLENAIKQVKPGNTVADISYAVQSYAEKNGFAVVKELVGHGVGYAPHEEPMIPNFVAIHQPKIELKPGMVLAIEPMLTDGTDRVKFLDDGWTVVTADGSMCAHFEHTVAVTEKGCQILTK